MAHVVYPETYQSLLDVVVLANLDMGWMLWAGCIINADFHDVLLMETVGPLVAFALLGTTYTVAIKRNRASEGTLHAVRRKHLGTVVLFTFVIYSSVSSAVFRTFACDELDDGSVYLRTDYRIECDSFRHSVFEIYAGLMVFVYPIGIPLFYAILLCRESNTLMEGRDQEMARNDSTSMLRKPYSPSVPYYEMVECSRRMLLTGVVVLLYPDTTAQRAVSTVIAFAFVVVSEVLSPYTSGWDTWVSRAGHGIVFLSMYVAFLVKFDVTNETQPDQNILVGILIGGHAIMVLLVIVQSTALLRLLKTAQRWVAVSPGAGWRRCSFFNSPASGTCG